MRKLALRLLGVPVAMILWFLATTALLKATAATFREPATFAALALSAVMSGMLLWAMKKAHLLSPTVTMATENGGPIAFYGAFAIAAFIAAPSFLTFLSLIPGSPPLSPGEIGFIFKTSLLTSAGWLIWAIYKLLTPLFRDRAPA